MLEEWFPILLMNRCGDFVTNKFQVAIYELRVAIFRKQISELLVTFYQFQIYFTSLK